MRNLEQLVCPHILAMQPYSSARSEFKGSATVFLDANENTFRKAYNRYPDPLQNALKSKIARLKNIQAQQLFLGNGSDEAIDLLLRIFCESGKDTIITLPPTYGMYDVAANLGNVKNIEIPLDKNYQPRVPAILEAQSEQTKLLFICSPNNPTGNDIELSTIETLLQKFQGIVVVDEAYIDFSNQSSCLEWLDRYDNLVVLQTFSKAWGMAGIRLGMAFSHPQIIALFNKVKPPYNINQLTQEYAIIALDKTDELAYQTLAILAERTRLKRALEQFPFVECVYPSSANFLLMRVKAPNALYRYLLENGIIIRNRSAVLGCEGCLRVSIGTTAENELLLTALENYLIKDNEQKSIVPRSRWDYSH